MKILYVSPYPPEPDGVGTYTRALADAVVDAGHEVGVVIPRPRPGSPPEVIGVLGGRGKGRRSAYGQVVGWKPDVVHLQFSVAAFGSRIGALVQWLRLVRRERPAPVVITMHEVTRDIANLRGPGRALYRWVAGHGDRIIVHTGAAREMLTTIGIPAATTLVIPHPSAQTAQAGRARGDGGDVRARFGLDQERILLAFGFIHVDKGLGDLVRALGILLRSRGVPTAGLRLVIAGAVRPRKGLFRVFEARDRLHLARVLRRSRRNGLDGHLVLTGYVPEPDVPSWFAAAEAVVLPYRKAEQSGVAGLATAFGVPVLASTAGGLGEQVTPSRWSYPPGRPDLLARVLADFLAAPAAEREPAGGVLPGTDLAAVTASTLEVYRAAARVMVGSGLRG